MQIWNSSYFLLRVSLTCALIVNDMCNVNGLTKYRDFLDIFPIEALKPGRLAKLHKTDKWIDL